MAITASAVFVVVAVVWITTEKTDDSVFERSELARSSMIEINFSGSSPKSSFASAEIEGEVVKKKTRATNSDDGPRRMKASAIEEALMIDLALDGRWRLAAAEKAVVDRWRWTKSEFRGSNMVCFQRKKSNKNLRKD